MGTKRPTISSPNPSYIIKNVIKNSKNVKKKQIKTQNGGSKTQPDPHANPNVNTNIIKKTKNKIISTKKWG